MTNNKAPKSFMQAVKDKVDLKKAEEAVQPRVVFQVSVKIVDNGQTVVEHPNFIDGYKDKQIAAIIKLLADGISIMVQEHYLNETGRIIRPV